LFDWLDCLAAPSKGSRHVRLRQHLKYIMVQKPSILLSLDILLGPISTKLTPITRITLTHLYA
jgi:hypothetical protein